MQSDILAVKEIWAEDPLLIAAQNSLGFEMVVASPSLQQIKPVVKGHTLAECNLGNMFQGDDHVLLHNHLLSMVDLLEVASASPH